MRIAKSALPNLGVDLAYRRRQRNRAARPYKLLAIYKVDRFGDAVLAIGAVDLLIRSFGVENCVLIGSTFSAQIAKRQWPSLEVVGVPFGNSRLWDVYSALEKLKRTPVFSLGVEHLICLRHQRTICDIVLLENIVANRSYGLTSTTARSDMETQLIRRGFQFDVECEALRGAPQECAELTRHRAVVQCLLNRRVLPHETLPKVRVESEAKELTVGISPFGSHSIRDLPFTLVLLLCQIALSRGARCTLWGERQNEQKYRVYWNRLQETGLKVDLMFPEGIGVLWAEVQSSAVIVSTETLTAHLATASDRALVAVIGGGHYGEFAPWYRSSRQEWHAHHLECFHCNWKCVHDEPVCLTQIPPSLVGQSLVRALSSGVP